MSDISNAGTVNIRGCCPASPAAPALYNRPGLPALSYRISTQPQFLQRMLANLPTQTVSDEATQGAPPLAALTSRALDDPAIALLDAWAVLADVLTFYQERIANEGYLRTATERRSVLELARTIGYELSPGVAASAYLAFTVESAAGAPGVATVPKATRVQSVPTQGQLPQTFETIADITTRADWNMLRPRRTQPQKLSLNAQSLYVAGVTTNLKPGDFLLLVAPPDNDATGALQTQVVRIHRVLVDPLLQRTRVDLVPDPSPPPAYVPPTPPRGTIIIDKIPLIDQEVRDRIAQRSWRERDLRAFMGIQGWRREDLLTYMTINRTETLPLVTPPSPPSMNVRSSVPSLPPAVVGVFAFRARVGFFGNNAPLHATLPDTLTKEGAVFHQDWDTNPTTIWTDSQGNPNGPGGSDVYLERGLQQVLPNDWVVFDSPTMSAAAFRVCRVSETSKADYALTGRLTGLTLAGIDGVGPPDTTLAFTTRATTAYAQSETLVLADLPIDETVAQGSTSLLLDTMVLGLDVGQPLAVQGVRADLPGVLANEIVILADIVHAFGNTTLWFQHGLRFNYVRQTLTINANVALASHGATVLNEVLGSGDGSQTNQRLRLKKPPLTYVSAPTPSGAQSTLLLRVNGVIWQEASGLYGMDDRSENFIVRIDNDGKASVIFGDGITGARPPTGTENIVATYRSGIGQLGLVAAGSLTLLQTRPLGIRSVTNPSDASGAADPESQDSARVNAPLTVLTLDRIVSLQDAEDFARAFAGIGKARAVPLWLGTQHLVHITVAATNGAVLDPASSLLANLVTAIVRSADPVQAFRVDSFQPLYFNLTAQVLVDTRHYQPADILANVQAALLAAFSFYQRSFAQPAAAAEIVRVVQAVPGVVATDLQQFYLVTDVGGPQQTTPEPMLQALPARLETGQIFPCQLLLINPAGVTLTEMHP
jgi:Baseplate J-like protein